MGSNLFLGFISAGFRRHLAVVAGALSGASCVSHNVRLGVQKGRLTKLPKCACARPPPGRSRPRLGIIFQQGIARLRLDHGSIAAANRCWSHVLGKGLTARTAALWWAASWALFSAVLLIVLGGGVWQVDVLGNAKGSAPVQPTRNRLLFSMTLAQLADPPGWCR